MRRIREFFISPFNGNSEGGTSLIEMMMAFAILGIGGMYSMSGISNLRKAQSLGNNALAAAEFAPIVKTEVSWVLEEFQRHITEATNADVRRTCNSPSRAFILAQDRFMGTHPVFFGDPRDILRERMLLDFGRTVLGDYSEVHQYLRRARAKSPGEQDLLDAMERCRRQTVASANARRFPIDNSFYFCGFGEGLLVEVKAMFWNYFNEQPLACTNMNAKGARGSRAKYQLYSFRKSSLVKKNNKGHYVVRQVSGQVDVPKKVDENL